MERENKEKNIDEPIFVFSFRVEEEFQNIIFSDIKNVSKIYEEVCKENENHSIKVPVLTYYKEKPFIIRLKSINKKKW